MMSRFQAALDKARATREVILAAKALNAGADVRPQTLSRDEAWAALPQRRINIEALAANRVITPSDDPEAAHFDIMRTKLLATAREKGWRRVAITSPTAGCGKSTVAMNLAFSMARNRETRTILLELDMRRPSFSALLDLNATAHLAGLFAGAGEFADHALRYGPNLAVSPCARPVRNPAELFHGAGTEAALRTIEAQYDPTLILCDLPPMMVGDDVLAIAPKLDAVLIVAAAETSSIAQIDSCERDLAEHCEVAGVILNKCHHLGEEYGYAGTYHA